VIVGIEACGYTNWFEELMEQLKQFYRRLVPRRGKARAKVAIARKLLLRCFIIDRSEIDYAEFLRRGKQEETE